MPLLNPVEAKPQEPRERGIKRSHTKRKTWSPPSGPNPSPRKADCSVQRVNSKVSGQNKKIKKKKRKPSDGIKNRPIDVTPAAADDLRATCSPLFHAVANSRINFSIITTVPSRMIPKSIAHRSRAGWPATPRHVQVQAKIMQTPAKAQAGIVAAT